MVSALFALVLFVSSVVAQAVPDVGSIRTHMNGSVLITAPGNGSVLLNGNDPLAEVEELKAKNAVFRQQLVGVRRVVAGLGIRQWTHQLGTNQIDEGRAAATDGDGNIFAVGYTHGGLDGNSNEGGRDMFVTKFASSGVKQWTRQLGTSSTDVGEGAATDGDGNVFAVGYTSGGLDGNSNEGGQDIFVTKFDSLGVKQWTRQLGTNSDDRGFGAATDGDGNVFVVGYTQSGLDGNGHEGQEDMFVTKFDNSGVKQWTRQLGTSSTDEGRAVATDIDGNVFVVGYTQGGLDGNSHEGGQDMFVTKFADSGVKQWTRQLGTSSDDRGYGAATDGDGNVFVVGYTYGGLDGNSNKGGVDMFVTKFDNSGMKQWTRQLGTSSEDVGNGAATDGDGNIFAVGYTQSGLDGNGHEGQEDMFVTKFDNSGVKQWTRQLGTSSSDISFGAATDIDGNVFVVGYTYGGLDGNTNTGSSDMFVTKFGLQ